MAGGVATPCWVGVHTAPSLNPPCPGTCLGTCSADVAPESWFGDSFWPLCWECRIGSLCHLLVLSLPALLWSLGLAQWSKGPGPTEARQLDTRLLPPSWCHFPTSPDPLCPGNAGWVGAGHLDIGVLARGHGPLSPAGLPARPCKGLNRGALGL